MIKRFFDILLSFLGLIILSPIFFLISSKVKLEDFGPIFYRGERIGLHGKPFRIFKFRTMVVDAEKLGPSSTSDADARITRFGRFLREYKLDELPQLINVLVGDMSLVGPRPQVKWAVDRYSEEERIILNIRPGITDDASILFSNEGEILKNSTNPDQDYLEKIHPIKTGLAMKYVQNQSLLVDIKIILKTIALIVKRSGGDDKK